MKLWLKGPPVQTKASGALAPVVRMTLYSMIGSPPSSGATHSTMSWFDPPVTVGAAGFTGTAAGITSAEAGDSGPNPNPFVALTFTTRADPLTRPVIEQFVDVGGVGLHVETLSPTTAPSEAYAVAV